MQKRLTDVFLSLLISGAFFIPFIIILILTTIFTKQFPILSQKRSLTLSRKPLILRKIRTIKSTQSFKKLEKSNNAVFKKNNFNEFVPSFCKWLRISGIDEIPQLINVIKGEMSLVGPRPMIEKDLLQIKSTEPELYKLRKELKAKPGITGHWQIFGDRKKGIKNLIEHDIYYEKNKSFLLDLKIIIKTIFVMLGAKHSDSIVSKRVREKIKELSFEQT